MPDTVMEGSSYEIRAEHFSPNFTDDTFVALTFGYKAAPSILIPLTKWLSNKTSMALKYITPPKFKGRIALVGRTAVRINDARVTDTEITFYFMLSIFNHTKQEPFDFIENVTLAAVYGKGKHLDYTDDKFQCWKLLSPIAMIVSQYFR